VRDPNGSVNIRHVAAEAGVGVGTVSRVLNASPLASEAVRRKVEEAMLRLNYRPNAQARRLLQNRSGVIVFLLSNREFVHPFHTRILQGVEYRAKELGQQVLFTVLHSSRTAKCDDISLPRAISERGWVDGILIGGSVYPNLIQCIERWQIPCVAFGNTISEFKRSMRVDRVVYDGEAAEREATRYLIQLGHKRIMFVGDLFLPWFREQHVGYRKALKEARIRPLEIVERRDCDYLEYGEWAGEQIAAMSPRPTAVLAGNDQIAFGLGRALRRLNLEVPRDISLIGFDDSREALLLDPPLTTIHIPNETIGRNCVDLLLKRIEKPHGRPAVLVTPVEFIFRDTVRSLIA
jgi:LacI family transcriptional regulator